MFSTLISADVLKAQLGPQLVIIDCRFDLADTEAGRRAYLAGHIPGAIYAHLDDDLSGPCEATKTGRHPLPCVTAAATLFSRWGITDGRQVVVYDDKRGAIAARLWWMLRWLGHEAVAVLDGGWAAWEAAGGPVSEEATKPIPANFTARPHEGWTVSAEEVDQWRANDAFAVVDSRAAERYRGEIEPIDPVAGHIPGARNLPFPDNWTAHGLMRPVEELRVRFAGLPAPERTAFYCGSGVTACHNILAYAHAGLGMPRLYPGSWSEWITDAQRPIATT